MANLGDTIDYFTEVFVMTCDITEKMTESEKGILNKYKHSMPFKVVEFSRELGVPVLLDKDMEDHKSGFIIFDDNKYYIVINKNQHELRNRFTIAHELGHYFYDKEYLKKYNKIENNILFDKEGDKNPEMDRRANQFAIELLVPEYFFKEKYNIKKHSDEEIKKIAKYFNVSSQVIAIRVKECFGVCS